MVDSLVTFRHTPHLILTAGQWHSQSNKWMLRVLTDLPTVTQPASSRAGTRTHVFWVSVGHLLQKGKGLEIYQKDSGTIFMKIAEDDF